MGNWYANETDLFHFFLT